MSNNRRVVEVKFIMPDHFYDNEDRLTQDGYSAIQELMEYGNLDFVGVMH